MSHSGLICQIQQQPRMQCGPHPGTNNLGSLMHHASGQPLLRKTLPAIQAGCTLALYMVTCWTDCHDDAVGRCAWKGPPQMRWHWHAAPRNQCLPAWLAPAPQRALPAVACRCGTCAPSARCAAWISSVMAPIGGRSLRFYAGQLTCKISLLGLLAIACFVRVCAAISADAQKQCRTSPDRLICAGPPLHMRTDAVCQLNAVPWQ